MHEYDINDPNGKFIMALDEVWGAANTERKKHMTILENLRTKLAAKINAEIDPSISVSFVDKKIDGD